MSHISSPLMTGDAFVHKYDICRPKLRHITYTYASKNMSLATKNIVMVLHPSTRPPKSLGLRKGAWTAEEDALLTKCMEKYGIVRWCLIPQRAGLNRCPRSCRMRWLNYLCPSIKRGPFEDDEVDLIIRLHKLLGNRWSLIAGRLPGRTATDIKNYWNNRLSKKLTAKNEKERSTTHVRVLKPQPKVIPLNWSWSKERPESPGKNLQKLVENRVHCPANIVTPEITDPVGSDIDNEITEELQAQFDVENMEIFRNDKSFMEGFTGWEAMHFDIDLWGDLGSL